MKKCKHCGSTTRYTAVWMNEKTGEVLRHTDSKPSLYNGEDYLCGGLNDCMHERGGDEFYTDEDFEEVSGFTYTLEQLADVLRQHGAVDSSTVEVLYTGGSIYNVNASLQWSWGEDDDASQEYTASLLCRFEGYGETSDGADDVIIINIESADDSPNQHGMASCPMKDYASVDEIEKDVLMFVDAGLCLFMSEILGREIISL